MVSRPLLLGSFVSILAFVSLGAPLWACGSGPKSTGFGDGSSSGVLNNPDGQVLGTLDASADAAPPLPLGYVTGRVLAPEGTIPISDTLVYLTDTSPPAIPDGVYCDKCVELTSYAYTYTAADGTFKLPVYTAGIQFVVTQKGQFRRVRQYDVKVGDTWPKTLTQLPGKNNPALGDSIPTMVVMPTAYDRVDRSLKKLGITEFDSLNSDNPLDISGQIANEKKADVLWKSAGAMAKYQYVFLPCGGGTHFDSKPYCSVGDTADSTKGRVLVDYVRAGGKVYTTDWNYEYVRQNWKGAVTWTDEQSMSSYGYACTNTASDAPAKFEDPALAAWMSAIGEGSATLKEMWTQIDHVSAFTAQDENGQPKQETPKVWVSENLGGTTKPATVSFQDKCGRVLYSSYHTESSDSGTLLAQEKALLHVLLEVGVCVGKKPGVVPK